MRRLLLLIFCALASTCLQAQEANGYDAQTIRANDIPLDAPRFSDFPALQRFRGKIAKPAVNASRETRLFRTRLREAAKDGPNFAGHYTIASWGCGAGCVSFGIIDANTGTIYFPKNFYTVQNDNIAFEELEPPEDSLVKFRLDSRLLIVIGGINEDPALRGISYFEWKHGHLRRIRFVAKPEGG